MASLKWSSTDQSKFYSFINLLKNNYINNVLGSGHQQNWAISAGYAKMAIGVYIDNASVYNAGLQIVQDTIVRVIKSDGTMPELCSRLDCVHFQYSLTGLTYAAEIDKIQNGNTLYPYLSKRILKGYEFMDSAFHDLNPCLPCSTKRAWPGVELAHVYYGKASTEFDRGITAPYGKTSDNTFLGFTTYTHRQY